MSREVRALIRRLSRENPLWGAPRVHGELQMLGIEIAQTTVANYMVRHRKPSSQTWRSFFDNHAKDLVSIDTRRLRLLGRCSVSEKERAMESRRQRFQRINIMTIAGCLSLRENRWVIKASVCPPIRLRGSR